jgi:hypothetical protein
VANGRVPSTREGRERFFFVSEGPMAFANTNITDLIATGIEARNRSIADNVLGNNPVTAQLKQKGRIKTFSGGHKIIEELSFTTNPNGGAYSGYDVLPTAPADVISAAEYTIKQYAVPVIVSGLETLQNAGKEALIDLVDARLEVAEATMANLLEAGVYGDGTAYSGKAVDGLGKLVEATATASQTATVGGISRTTYSFWRNYCVTGLTAVASTNVQGYLNTAWANLVRGADSPDLVIMGSTWWQAFMASLQTIQRFTDPNTAKLGFQSTKYLTADVFLGGGIGGVVNPLHCLVLNSKYIKFRPHSARNMVALDPQRRYAVNQDAYVQILAWAGNMTMNGAQFQGRLVSA